MPPPTDTYASLQKFALETRAAQEAGIRASNGMAPPVTYTMLTNRTFTGTGKVLRAENTMGRGVLYLDLNGDDQWELKADLGGLPLPEGLTEGVSVDFQATTTSVTMDGDRLVLQGLSAPALITVAGAK
jgi:hypothetical protein